MNRYQDMDSDKVVTSLTLEHDNAEIIAQWAKAIVVEEIDPVDASKKFPGLNVQCGDTVKRASLGDCIVRHDDGTYDVMSYLAFIGQYCKI